MNKPMQILNQLPPDFSSLDFGAFACSPGLHDSISAGSPHFGAALTPNQLMSPVGSPYQHMTYSGYTSNPNPGSPSSVGVGATALPLRGPNPQYKY